MQDTTKVSDLKIYILVGYVGGGGGAWGGGGGRGDGGRTEEWLRVNVKSVASGRIRINTGRWYNGLCT